MNVKEKIKCGCSDCVDILLRSSGLQYSSIRLRPDPTYKDTRSNYMIKSSCLINYHSSNSKLSLAEYRIWDENKKAWMKTFLNPVLEKSNYFHPCFPRLTAHRYDCSYRPRFWEKILGKKEREWVEYDIIFGNGRHRSYFMEYHGAEYIPIQTSMASASILKDIFGAEAIAHMNI